MPSKTRRTKQLFLPPGKGSAMLRAEALPVRIIRRGWGSSVRGDLNPEPGEISLITDLNSKTGEGSTARSVGGAQIGCEGAGGEGGDPAHAQAQEGPFADPVDVGAPGVLEGDRGQGGEQRRRRGRAPG